MGTGKLSQFQDNLANLNLNLPDEHLQRLNDASAIEPIFPNSFFAKEIVGNLVYGGMRDMIDAEAKNENQLELILIVMMEEK